MATRIRIITLLCVILSSKRPPSLPEVADEKYWTLVARVASGSISVSRAKTECFGDEVDLGRATRRKAARHLRLASQSEFEPAELVPKWWLEARRQLADLAETYQGQRWSADDAVHAIKEGEEDV